MIHDRGMFLGTAKRSSDAATVHQPQVRVSTKMCWYQE